MPKIAFLMLFVTGLAFFSGCGSRPSDISSIDESIVENPLPPCPNSPNCIRITKKIERPTDVAWQAALDAINNIDPENIDLSRDQWKIDSVFRVFFFRDDMAIRLTETGDSQGTSYLHIRSASRTGYSDLGVNTRRVRAFLSELERLLESRDQ